MMERRFIGSDDHGQWTCAAQHEQSHYIADPNKQTLHGFIAQELYEIYPQAVTVGGEDSKTRPWQVDYGKLTPLLVKSVQDIKAENEQLKAESAQLRAESAQLKVFLCGQFPGAPMCHP